MGSPLNGVLEYTYLELIESGLLNIWFLVILIISDT